MLTFKAIFDFILFSNIFVAFTITSLAFQTFYIFKIQADFYVLLFVFFSTLFVYSFHHTLGLKKISSSAELSEHLKWRIRNKKIMILILLLCLPLIFFCSLKFSVSHLMILVPLALISFGYSLPVISSGDKNIGLRNIPGLKIFLISFVISCVTVLLPVISMKENQNIADEKIFFALLEKFFFVFAITIPFDLRDMIFDKKNNIITFPIIFGEQGAKILAGSSLIFCVAATFVEYFFFEMNLCIFGGIIFSLVISVLVILNASAIKSEYFFSFTVESLMLLQTILILIFNAPFF